MKQLFTVFLVMGILPWATAQVSSSAQTTRAINTLERFAYGNFERNVGGNIPLMPMKKPETVGQRFLNRSWNKTSFLLYGSEEYSEAYQAKYDLLDQEIAVYFPTGMKVIRNDKIKSFIWMDSLSNQSALFVNGLEFKDPDETPITGFFQVLVEGEVSLLKKTDAEIHSHNYNVALSVGRKDNEINQKVQYYYLRDDKVVHLLPRAKDKFKLIFKGHQEEIAHFMKLNDVKLEKEHHLEALFEHYNSLLAK